MKPSIVLVVCLACCGLAAEGWPPALQAELAAARQDASWSWRAERVRELEACNQQLDQAQDLPPALRDAIATILRQNLSLALAAAPPPPAAADRDPAAAFIAIGKQRGGQTRYLVRFLGIMHRNWDPRRHAPDSVLAREVLGQVHTLMARIERSFLAQLELETAAIAEGRELPPDRSGALQQLIYMPPRIMALVATTSDLQIPWAQGHRTLAAHHAAEWLGLGRDLLALEGGDPTAMQVLLGRQDRLEQHAMAMQAVAAAAQAEARAQAEVAVLRREARPAVVAELDDLLAALAAIAPAAMPADEAALMTLVERATLAAGRFATVRTLTNLARAEARMVEREARARAAGRLDEAALVALRARLDAALRAVVALEAAQAATRARVALLEYKQRHLDLRARVAQEDHGAILRELDRLLAEPDGRVPPGAGGVATDDPADLVLPE